MFDTTTAILVGQSVLAVATAAGLTCTVWLGRRLATPAPAATVEIDQTAFAQRIEAALSQQADYLTATLNGLQADVAALRADVEWLAGERMIEAAVNLARDGLKPADISASTGLSEDAVRTITLFRAN